MKARDIFGIIVRSAGVFMMLYAVYYFGGGCYAILTGTPWGGYFAASIPSAVVGMLMVGLGRFIVRFSYPGNRDDSEP